MPIAAVRYAALRNDRRCSACAGLGSSGWCSMAAPIAALLDLAAHRAHTSFLCDVERVCYASVAPPSRSAKDLVTLSRTWSFAMPSTHLFGTRTVWCFRLPALTMKPLG